MAVLIASNMEGEYPPDTSVCGVCKHKSISTRTVQRVISRVKFLRIAGISIFRE